jgi:hypothetical protein
MHLTLLLDGVMLCLEYTRLRQQYGFALRNCGRVVLADEAEAVKQKAFQDRDAAKEKIRQHELQCPICILNKGAQHFN